MYKVDVQELPCNDITMYECDVILVQNGMLKMYKRNIIFREIEMKYVTNISINKA